MLSLIFKQRPKGMIGEIELDATLSERHDFTNTVTNHPVEDGAIISDHVYDEPDRLSIDGLITDSPIRLFGIGVEPNRAQNAFDALLELKKRRAELTVVTGLKVYQNMVLTGLSIPKDSTSGQAIRFTADLQNIQTVETQTVTIAEDRVGEVAIEQAPSELDLGNQVPIEAPPEVTESASWALQIYEGAANVVENLFGGVPAGAG